MTVSTQTTSADPSMDEILASIRRMLKEDDQTNAEKSAAPALDAAAPASAELSNVIALDASMLDPTTGASVGTSAGSNAGTSSGSNAGSNVEVGTSAAAAPVAVPSAPAIVERVTAEPSAFEVPSFEALSASVNAVGKSGMQPPVQSGQAGAIGDEGFQAAFSSAPDLDIPNAIMGDQAARDAGRHIGSLVRTLHGQRRVAVSRGGPTIEDIVREELRPMLKSWLDANLPHLVERVVRAEIDRLIDPSDR